MYSDPAETSDLSPRSNLCRCSWLGCDYLASLPGIGLCKSRAFWTKVTNPDVRAVLPKIPSYLKMTTVVTEVFYNLYNKLGWKLSVKKWINKQKLTKKVCEN